jgi:hypothetical protein
MSPHQELNNFLRITSKLAQAQLESRNRMHFGAILEPDSNVRMLVPQSMKEAVTWDELISYWKRELAKATSMTPWKAVSSCIFTSYCAFAEFEKRDAAGSLLEIPQAFVIHIEHSSPQLQPENVAYPYLGNLGSSITVCDPTRAAAERWLPNSIPANG